MLDMKKLAQERIQVYCSDGPVIVAPGFSSLRQGGIASATSTR